MKKILYITFLSYLLLNSCSDNSIQNGDTIFIEFKIINNKKERIDENSLCNGKKLLLKVVLGENFLPKIIEKKIIGKVYGETIRMSINSTDLYKYNLYYTYCSDTNFLVKSNEQVLLKIETYSSLPDFQ